MDGSLLNVQIDKESDLWPTPEEPESVIGLITTLMSMSIKILKTPVDLEKFMPVFGNGDFDATGFIPKRAVLDWDIKKRSLSIIVGEDIDKNLWRTSGKITSIVDLRGAQLLLFPSGGADVPIPALSGPPFKLRRDIVRSMNIRHFTLELGQGRSLRIPARKFNKTKVATGDPVFSVVFPSKEREFTAFFEERDSD